MKNISKKNWVLYIVTFLVIVIGDQLTKILVSSSMMLGQSQAIIDNFFYYTYSHNQGAAWGMLSGHISLFVVVSLAAAIFMFYYFSKTTKAQRLTRYGIVLTFAGLVGNLTDRLYFGYVRDFIDELPKLIELGVDSFKIEGRMKSLHYIATVVSTYRKLIDTYCADPDHFNKEGYRKEIEKAANRALCTGFFKDFPDSQYQLYNQRDEHPTQDFCARVLSYDVDKHEVMIEQRNYFKVGDQIEFFSPHHENILIQVKEIYNEDRESVEVANHPMEILYLKCDQPLFEFDMGRKVILDEK